MFSTTTAQTRFARRIARHLSAKNDRFAQDESGSILIFSIFLFMMTILIGGMAVDVMYHEQRRVTVQNTMDSAILGASSLNQGVDAKTLVLDYAEKAGIDPDTVTVVPVEARLNGGQLTMRRVSAKADVDVNTFFMKLLGVNRLEGEAGGTATEGVQNVEISLIVDISGSMGENERMKNLKIAAKDFIQKVMVDNNTAGTTSMSIVPYNATVVVGNELLSRLDAAGDYFDIVTPAPYAGAMTSYATEHNASTCVRFEDDDFDSRGISATTDLVRVSHFRGGTNDFKQPTMNRRWCNENRSEILVHSTVAQDLKDHIDAMSTGGWTGIDNGMKWGVALLDPALEPVLTGMVDDELLSEAVRGRPGAYDKEQTKKVIVLMTDGDNTIQRDLKSEFKYGPTRIWYSETSTTGFDAVLNRDRTEFDGYFVLMPDNNASERWFVPGDPNTTDDDVYMAEGALPADAEQMDYHAIYARFAVEDAAKFFFEASDTAAFNAHMDAVEQTEGYGQIDARLQKICDEANKNEDIEVYAIGFEAPQAGLDAMKGCASSIGYYFDVDGKGISKAFDSIAGQIAMLRLTQ
jgi:hypothetical protein